MKIPKYIEFLNETNLVLSGYLKGAEPAEGCAILIGKKKSLDADEKNYFWEIKHIWNCRNIWGEQESKLISQNTFTLENQKISNKNRFEINAKDQIAAQKWARGNDLQVLCCAHSHPVSDNKPSKTDLFLHKAPGLMVIANQKGNLKAWWIIDKFSYKRVKIKKFSLT